MTETLKVKIKPSSKQNCILKSSLKQINSQREYLLLQFYRYFCDEII